MKRATCTSGSTNTRAWWGPSKAGVWQEGEGHGMKGGGVIL